MGLDAAPHEPRTRRGLSRVAAALSLWLAAAPAGAPASEAAGEDPVHVYYAGRDCPGDVIELEVFDRETGVWRAHPEHAQIPVRSCQREDAGHLLNELRWRCRPEFEWAPTPWRRLDVFDPEVMARCAVGQIDPARRRSAISVDSPREGSRVAAEDPVVEIAGSVRIDGVDGNEYDVVLLVDLSAGARALESQLAAARALVRSLAPRLGAVRIALLTHPHRPTVLGEKTSGRLELDFSTRAEAVDAALAALAGRSEPGPPALAGAVDAALAQLQRARPAARPVLLIGADGAALDGGAASPNAALAAAARRAAQRGAELHWFALAGLAAEPPAALTAALEAAPGSFRRIPPRDFGESYFESVPLPVAAALWVENETLGTRGAGAVHASGRFAARAPVAAGPNTLRIHAQLSDGSVIERPFELIFDDRWVLRKILRDERERISEARRKQLELEVEE